MWVGADRKLPISKRKYLDLLQGCFDAYLVFANTYGSRPENLEAHQARLVLRNCPFLPFQPVCTAVHQLPSGEVEIGSRSEQPRPTLGLFWCLASLCRHIWQPSWKFEVTSILVHLALQNCPFSLLHEALSSQKKFWAITSANWHWCSMALM